MSNPNSMMEQAIQAELGARTMEILKLRVIVATHTAEIARLQAEIASLKAAAPELPLVREATNGAAHH